MSFEHFGFDPRIETGICNAGFASPTPIQQQAIPVVLAGRDIYGLAQTGTGKTAAYVLPILQRLSEGDPRALRALIMAPTRELAEQIHQDICQLGRRTRVRSVPIYGGVSKRPQIESLRRGVNIVVACPGRLLDHMSCGDIDLSRIEVLVLDEADRMCDMGFLPDIRRIVGHLPADRQTMLFSATMPDDIRTLADRILKDPVTVQIGIIAPAETVSHALYPVAQKQKRQLLFALLETTARGRVLVFTRTKYRARNLARDLDRKGYRSAALQGNMSQNRRQEAIDGFRRGKYDILVATDIASRGIDVSEIAYVINFDMPDTVDAYIHRIGRTGRAENDGSAISMATADDRMMIRDIEKVLGERIERRELEGFGHEPTRPSSQESSQQRYSRSQTPRGPERSRSEAATGPDQTRRRRRRPTRRPN